MIVGAPGPGDYSAHIFDTAPLNQVGRLFSVANVADISGNVAVIGSRTLDESHFPPQYRTAAYLFDVSTSNQIARLFPENAPQFEDGFGLSVAIEGDYALVGDSNEDTNGIIDSGVVYLFDANTGTQIAKLLPENGTPDERFGTSIAIDGNVVVIGASGSSENGVNSGAAYVFHLPAVPEPSSLYLGTIGLAAAGLRRRC